MTQLLEILIIILILMVISGWFCIWRRRRNMNGTIAKLNRHINDKTLRSPLIVKDMEHLDRDLKDYCDALNQAILYEMKMTEDE